MFAANNYRKKVAVSILYILFIVNQDREWRKNFSINVKRAGPRSEKSVFENVRIIGMHRHLGVKEEPHQDEMAPSTSSEDPGQVPINTDILVFFVKICRPEPLVDRLVAASKDEYVTRHLIDGRIINCDQRISLIAGYMIEEIHGKSAFMYMHRDDVRWVMIALRQMYDRGESKGNSCYRLKSRNGQFIYLRTFGYLEIDDKGVVESFVCINTLVDEKDGKALTEEMKRRYSTLINSNYMPISNGQGGHHQTPMYSDRVTFTSASSRESHPRIIEIDSTEDPVKIEQAVTQLMTGLQSDDADSPSPSPVEPYRTTSSSTNSECDISATVGKPHHLRLKTGKRSSISSSSSEPYGKRQRCTSTDSMSPQMSPEARLPRMDPTQMSPQSIASKMTPTQETRPIRRSMSSTEHFRKSTKSIKKHRNSYSNSSNAVIEIDSTEDPVKIEQAVTQLMTGLQSDDADSPSPSPVEPYRTTSSSTNSECDISATVGKPHHLRLKTGKRSSISSSSSEPYGKRQRCTSTDSMSPQMSPEARLPRMDPTQMSPQSIASKMTPTQETRPIRRSMSSIGKQLQDDFEEHDDTI